MPGVFGSSWTWVVLSAACWAAVFYRYSWDPLIGLAAFLLLGACVLPLRGEGFGRLLAWRPLAMLGVASYSLYLWHLPIIDRLATADFGGYLPHLLVGMVVTIAVAVLSYRLIEQPFLRMRRAWGDTASRPNTL